MMVAGPISDRLGRRRVLKVAAVLFAVSAVASALAPNFVALVVARMVGGFGVGAALIIAPMYIAELAPPESRGRLVSFNQLNIVIGISAAFFSNYLILTLGQSDLAWAEALRMGEWNWRWMLGVETLPALVYYFALFAVPDSPRWLAMHGREDEALQVLEKVSGTEQARANLREIHASLQQDARTEKVELRELFHPSMKLVFTIGVSVGILQQITGINSVFFYAPMIFEQSGIGTNAAFMQAVLVGLTNLVFTIVAMALIDRLGRRPLLGFGLTGIAVCMLALELGVRLGKLCPRQAVDRTAAGRHRPRGTGRGARRFHVYKRRCVPRGCIGGNRRGRLPAARSGAGQHCDRRQSRADSPRHPGFRGELRRIDRPDHVGALFGAVPEQDPRAGDLICRPRSTPRWPSW